MDFREAMAQYWKLRSQHEAGTLGDAEFEAAVGDLTVVDAQGDAWQIGVSTGRWYRFDGQTWVEGFPALPSEDPSQALLLRPTPGPASQPRVPRSGPASPPPGEFPQMPPPPGWRSGPGAGQPGPTPQAPPPSKSRLPLAGIIVAVVVGCLCVVACVAAVILAKPDILPDGLPFLPSASPVPAPGTAALRVENRASTDICYMLISPSTSSEWGEDWLGPTETIPPGASRDFAVSPPQNYDLQALDCNASVMAEQYGVNIGASGATWSVGP